MMQRRREIRLFLMLAMVPCAMNTAQAVGPDVIVSNVAHDNYTANDNDIVEYGVWTDPNDAGNQIAAFMCGTVACNIGPNLAEWFGGGTARHPLIAQNMYRLKDGRFEHVGLSWVKHSFCAEDLGSCAGACQAEGTCSFLGTNCEDTYWGSLNGDLSRIGPRSAINPGVAPGAVNHTHPVTAPTGPNPIRGRLQVKMKDLDPALNAGALYFVEGHYITHDELTREMRNNNASWRRVNVASALSVNTMGGMPTQREQAAINAWPANESGVTLVHVQIPDDGRMTLGYKVTNLGNGKWHYEYALHNMNSDRCGQSLSVPIAPWVYLSNVGFHDVDHHSGEPWAGTDWTHSLAGGQLTWQTQTFAQNANANALRWSTMYNFRFDSNAPPVAGNVTVGLFKPGTPTSITFATMVPASSCTADTAYPRLDHARMCASRDNGTVASGYIDSRAESSNGVDGDLGLSQLTMYFTEPVYDVIAGPPTLNAASFSVNETGAGQPPAVTAVAVDPEDPARVTLTLSRHLTLQEWTTVSVNVRDFCGNIIVDSGNQGPGVNEDARLDMGFLPPDVDQSGCVNPVDLLRFKQIANDVLANPCLNELMYVDIDRNGNFNPVDLLRFKQLVNGVNPPSTQSWSGRCLNHTRP